MGDTYFHHRLNALTRAEGGRGDDLVDLGSPFHSDASADPLFGARRIGRGRRRNIPVLSGGRAVRRAQGAPSMTALAVFAFVAAGIAAYAASAGRDGDGGPGRLASRSVQNVDFPTGTVFLTPPR